MTTETGRPVGPTARALQDGIEALIAGYADQYRRWAELTGSWWGRRNAAATTATGAEGEAAETSRQTWQQIAEGTREVTAAGIAVAGEWLRAPWWALGAGSPSDLQARYFRLFEAQRRLAQTYLDAALQAQQAVTGATERVVTTAKASLDTQVQTARRLANDAREAQTATVEATREVAETARTATRRVAQEARRTTETVTAETGEAIRDTADATGAATRETVRATEQVTRAAADVSREATDRFAEAAQTASSRAAEAITSANGAATTPVGEGTGTAERLHDLGLASAGDLPRTADVASPATDTRSAIKGKINRDGEKIYHLPGQANYDRVEADVVFETEEAAREAGFRPSQR